MSSFANQVLLAKKWDDSIDPTGYWMSEKMDGVRAYWSGSDFYSRAGNMFHAPDWFKKDLPKEPLDGELWAGRGLFQKCVGIVKTKKRTKEKDERWKFLTYLVFDAPHLKTSKGRAAPFESRVEWIKKNIDSTKETTYAAAVGQRKCESKEHLLKNLKKVVDVGGEGMMLRVAGSQYQTGRNKTLLKVKVFHDEEAKVIGWEHGSGKNSNVMGHLRCVLPNGMEFSVGSGFTDAQRKKPPKNGTVITFKYQELSNSGKPRFPTFLRFRGDVTWEEVCANAKTKKPFSETKKKERKLKKQHTILFTSVPSRDQITGLKQVTDDDNMEDDDDGVAVGSVVPEICKYGAKCYQTNAAHLARFAHPDKPKPEGVAPGEACPACKWGAKCFQTNALHLEKYSHPPPGTPVISEAGDAGGAEEDDEGPQHEPSEDDDEEAEEAVIKSGVKRAGTISADEINRKLDALDQGLKPMELDGEEQPMVTVPVSMLENLRKRVQNLEKAQFEDGAEDEFLDVDVSSAKKKRRQKK